VNTIDFFKAILNWVLADPSHIVVLAGVIAALTPTPEPNSVAGKFYKVLDLFALNFLHAKDSGVKTVAISDIRSFAVEALTDVLKTLPLVQTGNAVAINGCTNTAIDALNKPIASTTISSGLPTGGNS